MQEGRKNIEFDKIIFQENPIIKQPGVKEYFDGLPEFIKESLMQSGVEIESESHLKQLAEHFMRESKKNKK